jgi:pyruvate formate lyase activating enzyme
VVVDRSASVEYTVLKLPNRDAGIIFNIQRFSIYDGPGIRTTVFFKGCPLNCLWCSNPEGINSKPEILVSDGGCIHCGKCKEVCPESAVISLEGNKKERIDLDKCTECMECVSACPTRTLDCIGKYASIDEIVEELGRDSLFYRNSGGGITVSGGEPLLQAQFARGLLSKCKESGFHVTLDTTGFASRDILRTILKFVDLVLFDIKHLDDTSHKHGTGVSNSLILSNFEKTAQSVRTWLRYPIIPGFNDATEHVEGVADLAFKVGIEKVSLLPYHEWGKHKYAKLGREYSFASYAVSSDQLFEIKQIFESKRMSVTIKK